jgi:hypothetical protein
MPIRHEEIIATVETSEFKLAGDPLDHFTPQQRDNLVLDRYGFAIDAIHKNAIDVPSVSMVYAAAKVTFALHPGATFTFDFDSASSACGSPWEHQCTSAEEWAACFARRWVETQDGHVDDDEVDADVVTRARQTLNILRAAGVPVDDDITALVCHDSERLREMFSDELLPE